MAATYRLFVTDERALDGAHHRDFIQEMISGADIWRAALAMMKRYRADAMLEAAARGVAASNSVRNGRILGQHLVVPSADLDRLADGILVAWGGEHHALARRKKCLEAHGRSGLALRQDGDDPETVALGDSTKPPCIAAQQLQLLLSARRY